MSSGHNVVVENLRLDSWKEIAAFFRRDERTVRRWEKERNLPILRVPSSERGRVFAYKNELTAWLHSDQGNSATIGLSVSLPPGENVMLPSLGGNEELPASPSNSLAPCRATPSRQWVIVGWCFAAAAFVTLAVLMIRYAPLSPPGGKAHHVPDPQAQEFYLQGRYFWNRRTGDSLNKAIDFFTQAIIHDSDYAQAYAGLADTYDLLPEYAPVLASEAYPKAIAAATRAVTLDDSLSEAHRALAFGLFFWNWDVPRALNEFHKAIQLDPNDIEAHHWYSSALLSLGRYEESFSEIERARELSPTSRSILADRALILHYKGDDAAAISILREIGQAEPDFLSPPRYLARISLFKKDYPSYIAEMKRAAVISQDPKDLALAEAVEQGWQMGGETGMMSALAATQKRLFEDGKSSNFEVAYAYALVNQKEEALRYLQASFDTHEFEVFSIIHPFLRRKLGGNPEFEQLTLRVRPYLEGKIAAPVPALSPAFQSQLRSSSVVPTSAISRTSR